MENLISMTDFVLEQNQYREQRFSQVVDYALFLKQPLELWMFVPCDADGSVLLHPYDKIYPASMSFNNEIEDYNLKFKQAKERCLFYENFKVKKHGENNVVYLNDSSFYTPWNKSKTIEDLLFLNLKLTETAKKMLF